MIFKLEYVRNLKSITLLIVLLFAKYNSSLAQSVFKDKEALFTTPNKYIAVFSEIEPVIDGKIDDQVWQNAAWSEQFRDIEGDSKPAPTWNTRTKMIWTKDGLYIAAEILDPHVWAYLKNHDDVVFYDNDFEVFIDPDNNTHAYYEIEVNAINTIFDLFMPKPYRNDSGAMIVYDTPGMKSAVSVQGTLNNPSDVDKGWTTEIFVPFKAVTIANQVKVPADGEFWRVNFSRVEWDVEVKGNDYIKLKGANGRNLPEHNWVWSPQGVINMHYPERWGYVFFSKGSGDNPKYQIPYSESQRKHLWLVYYLQKEFRQKNKTYAKDLKELGISETSFNIDGKDNKLWMEATSDQFMAYISGNGNTYSVNDEGLVSSSLVKP